eukprot:1549768-Pyramimonas_sp.AAC.2
MASVECDSDLSNSLCLDFAEASANNTLARLITLALVASNVASGASPNITSAWQHATSPLKIAEVGSPESEKWRPPPSRLLAAIGSPPEANQT